MTEPRFARASALMLACTVACTGVWAQAGVPSAAAASAAERAQRETDRTMYWIRVLATKPAVAKAPPAPAPTPAVAPAAPAPKPVVAVAPAAKPAADARDKVKVAAATRNANAPVQVALADPAPAPDAPYPSALSTPGVDRAASMGSPLAMPAPPESAPPVATEEDPGLSQIKLVQPDFPGIVVKRVRRGNVEVHFEVDPGGTVTEATVVESSNHKLDAAAIDAIKQWRFKPTPMYHTAAVNLVFDIDKE
jgi:protein TonB